VGFIILSQCVSKLVRVMQYKQATTTQRRRIMTTPTLQSVMFIGVVTVLVGLFGSSAAIAGTPQCTSNYTTCVLSCNRKTVVFAQKKQKALSPRAASQWGRRLRHAQTKCIPQCYQVHCLGKTIAKAKTIAMKGKKKK
jgi:hypothetical protein